MENQTRIRRLKQLSYMLKNHDTIFPKVKFNLRLWKGTEESCGTAACALGSACLYQPFVEAGLGLHDHIPITQAAYKEVTQDAQPIFQGKWEFEAGADFFGITSRESVNLFAPTEYTAEYGKARICPGAVAKRVDQLIKQYGGENAESSENKTTEAA